jgi:hypothetical protein
MNEIPEELILRIKQAFLQGNYIISDHAFLRMTERKIDSFDVRNAVLNGEAIEFRDLGANPVVLFNGHSLSNRAIHVSVVERAKGRTKHLVITLYEPSLDSWRAGFRIRIRGGS